jgi:hypothetical protein
MSLPQLISTVLRHWLVAGLVLVATIVAGFVLVQRVEPDYEATGTVVLLPPSTAMVGSGEESRVDVNPYARFGNPQAILSTAIVGIMESGPMQTVLEARGVDGVYDIAVDPGGGGAIMILTVTAKEPQSALDQLSILLTTLQSEVIDRQRSSGAPTDTWFNAAILSTPDEPTPQFGSRTRVLAAVVTIGGVGVVAAALLSEALTTHRRRRRDAAEEAEAANVTEVAEVAEELAEEARVRRLVLKPRRPIEPAPSEGVG